MSQLRVNEIVSENGSGVPNFPNGATGISTVNSATSANYASIAGIATVAEGLTGSPDIAVGNITATGVVTATSFEGDGTNLVLDYQDLTIRSWIFGPG